MILAVCIDDQNGLMFNGRRVSSDKAVVQDLMKKANVQILVKPEMPKAPAAPKAPAVAK